MSRRNRAEPQCRFRRRLPSQQRAGPDNKARDGRGTEGSNPSPSCEESVANLLQALLGGAADRNDAPRLDRIRIFSIRQELPKSLKRTWKFVLLVSGWSAIS